MCEAKPGPRCASDTCAHARDLELAYSAAHPDGPMVTPLAAAESEYATPGVPREFDATGLVELSPATRRVVDAITNAGGRPYLVGGTVRDALAHPGLRPKDVDIEVFGLPFDDLNDALGRVGRVDEVGRAFSVLKIRIQGEDFDVSLPRRDIKTGDGHRGFTVEPDPFSTLEAASSRRDFTINALMYDPSTGRVIDCWGGVSDLRAGVLRHVSPAFAEDPLRVLRAAQFSSRFGLRVAPETVDLCRSLADRYPELSKERVWTEWQKIATKGADISAAVDTLEQTGWLRHFPSLANLRGVPQDPTWHPEGDVLNHSALAGTKAAELAEAAGLTGDDRTVVSLAALLHDTGKVTHTQLRNGRITSHGHADAGVDRARAFLNEIGAPHDITARVLPLVREHMASVTVKEPTPVAVRRLTRRLAPASIREWALVVSADKGSRGAASRDGEVGEWLTIAESLGTTEQPVPAILRGNHLIATGMRPGPSFKPILAEALAAQDDGVFTDEEGAIAWLRDRLRP